MKVLHLILVSILGAFLVWNHSVQAVPAPQVSIVDILDPIVDPIIGIIEYGALKVGPKIAKITEKTKPIIKKAGAKWGLRRVVKKLCPKIGVLCVG